jgi:hypothetical protein
MAGQRLDLGEVNQDRSASATATASRPRATGATSLAGAAWPPVLPSLRVDAIGRKALRG